LLDSESIAYSDSASGEAREAAAAQALIRFLSSREAASAITNSGLSPVAQP